MLTDFVNYVLILYAHNGRRRMSSKMDGRNGIMTTTGIFELIANLAIIVTIVSAVFMP